MGGFERRPGGATLVQQQIQGSAGASVGKRTLVPPRGGVVQMSPASTAPAAPAAPSSPTLSTSGGAEVTDSGGLIMLCPHLNQAAAIQWTRDAFSGYQAGPQILTAAWGNYVEVMAQIEQLVTKMETMSPSDTISKSEANNITSVTKARDSEPRKTTEVVIRLRDQLQRELEGVSQAGQEVNEALTEIDSANKGLDSAYAGAKSAENDDELQELEKKRKEIEEAGEIIKKALEYGKEIVTMYVAGEEKIVATMVKKAMGAYFSSKIKGYVTGMKQEINGLAAIDRRVSALKEENQALKKKQVRDAVQSAELRIGNAKKTYETKLQKLETANKKVADIEKMIAFTAADMQKAVDQATVQAGGKGTFGQIEQDTNLCNEILRTIPQARRYVEGVESGMNVIWRAEDEQPVGEAFAAEGLQREHDIQAWRLFAGKDTVLLGAKVHADNPRLTLDRVEARAHAHKQQAAGRFDDTMSAAEAGPASDPYDVPRFGL